MQGRDDGGEYLGVVLVELLLDFVAEAVDDGTVFDAHEVDPCIVLVADDGSHVDILHVGVYHCGACLIFLQQMYLALDKLGFLEAQLFGGGIHTDFHLVEYVAKVAFQQPSDALDGGLVFLFALFAGAGGSAKAYLVLHAGPFAHCVAGAVLEQGADDVL